MKRTKYQVMIGIDCGVNTGICVYIPDTKYLRLVATKKIHEAMDDVKYWKSVTPGGILVRVEDARKRTWFGKATKEVLQGAGSIKRDSKIWEDFLKDLNVDYEMVAPKNNKTKLSAPVFSKMTGYPLPTNEHGRDAAMLVVGF
jgi:TATA-box binding protein (TBP) (component of TFIID and TFIIIB)